ncbi:MAG TPA: flagellar hook-length control protein FliK [archaeon]|nr:flagellar hook-length control protein FliK [archaeon]
MINDLAIFQLLAVPAPASNGTESSASSSQTGHVSFSGLLGGLMEDNSLTQAANKSSAPSLSSSPGLPSNSLANINFIDSESDSPLQAGSPLLSTLSGLKAMVLGFLNQISAQELVPLNIAFDLQGLAGEQLDLLKTLGISSLNNATLFVKVTDLENLAGEAASSNGEITLPVFVMLGGDGEKGQPLSLVSGTLTVKTSENNSDANCQKNIGEMPASRVEYFLNLECPVFTAGDAQADMDPEQLTEDKSSASALWDSLARVAAFLSSAAALLQGESSTQHYPENNKTLADKITDILISGNAGPQTAEQQGLTSTARLSSPNGMTSQSPAGVSDLLNTSDNISTIPVNTEAGSQVEVNPEVDSEDSSVEQSVLLLREAMIILTDFLGKSLKQALETGDSERAHQVFSLLERLSRLDELSPAEQAVSVNSLLNEIKRFYLSGRQEAQQADFSPNSEAQPLSGLETQSTEMGNDDPARPGLEMERIFAFIKRLGSLSDKLNVSNQTESSTAAAGNAQTPSVEKQDQGVKILTEAANRLAGFVQALLREDNEPLHNQPDSQTGSHLGQLAGLVEKTLAGREPVNTQKAADYPGLAGKPSNQFGNPAQAVMDTDIGEPQTGMGKIKAPEKSVPEGSSTREVERAVISRTFELEPLNGKDSGKNELLKLQGFAEKTAIKNETQKITVPIQLVGQTDNKTSGETKSRHQATVEYIKQSQQGGSSSNGETKLSGSFTGLQSTAVEGVVDEFIDTLREKQAQVEELRTSFERLETAGGKIESQPRSLRFDLNSLRPAAETQDQNGRTTWLVNQKEVFDKITSAARLSQHGGTSEISLRLEPDHLGFMRVRLTVDNNQTVTARIQVETQEARSLIEGSLHRLKDSLAEQGLKVEKFNVDVRQDQNQQQAQQHSPAAGREGHYRSTRNFPTADNQFAGTEKDLEPIAKIHRSPTGKFSYSTLEWVA